MKVKELITELRQMPQDMKVGVSMGDNSEGEIAGYVFSVCETEEIDMETGEKTGKIVVDLHC